MGDRARWGAEPGPVFEGRCNWCGSIDLFPEDLGLHVRPPGEALVEFSCPDCGLNVRALDAEDVETLAVAGVAPLGGVAPFELLEERSGPPIGWDDLIDFHDRMARHDPRGAGQDRSAGRSARREQKREAA